MEKKPVFAIDDIHWYMPHLSFDGLMDFRAFRFPWGQTSRTEKKQKRKLFQVFFASLAVLAAAHGNFKKS